MEWKVVLDLIVTVLLITTIGYAIMLNQRLTQLRKNRDDFAKIVQSFNDSTLRAESSIPKLRKAAEDAGMALQERVEKAHSLRDDLAFMIERADTMANRLENSVRTARAEVRPAASAPGGAAVAAVPGGALASRPPPASFSLSGTGSRSPASPSSLDGGGGDDDRSEAERELLRALQAMR